MKILSKIFKNKKTTLITAVLLISVLALGGKVLAASWGPERPTFTWGNPPSYITYNSFTNNPVVGDERFFFAGNIIPGTPVMDEIQVKDGDVAHLRIHFHNNANPDLGLKSTNTRVKVTLPKIPVNKTWANAYMIADNSNPKFVFDSVNFVGERPLLLEYIPGTAVLHNNFFKNGTPGAPLSDDIVGSGALVGYDSINGVVPGGPQYAGFVNLKVRVKMEQPPVQPVYRCDLLTLNLLGDRKVRATVNYTAQNGATFKSTTFNWGDGTTPLNVNTNTAEHTYAKDGTYTVRATVFFTVDGKEVSHTSEACSKSLTITTPVTPTPPAQPPAEIHKAGPGSVVGLFAGASGLAAAGHYLVSARRSRL